MRALWLRSALVAMASVAGRCWPMSTRPYPHRLPAPYLSAVRYDLERHLLRRRAWRGQCPELNNDFTQEMVEQSTTGFAGGAHTRLQKQSSWIVAGAAHIQIR